MINIIKYKLDGLLSFENKVFEDERGFFLESFNSKVFNSEYTEKVAFVQDNLSHSKKGVLRGLHFQKPPHAQAKLVRVVKGACLDVVVDIRKTSKTYGQHETVLLTANNFRNLFVPRGFAHGFLALEDETIFSYKCDNFYNWESEDALRWNDEDLNIDWNIQNPIVSAKDQEATLFKNFKTPFE